MTDVGVSIGRMTTIYAESIAIPPFVVRSGDSCTGPTCTDGGGL